MASSGKELDVGPGLVGNCHWTAEELSAVLIWEFEGDLFQRARGQSERRLSLHRPGW